MSRRVIKNLHAYEYQHPFDRQALELLKNTKGFKKVMQTISEYGTETFYRIRVTGSGLRVTASNFESIYRLLQEACRVLDIKDIPELYMVNGETNAQVVGVNNPILVISPSMVDNFTEEELLFIFGHQLSYVQSESVLYQQITDLMQIVAHVGFGAGKLILMPVQYALGRWQKMAKFTADRAGLLCCQDVEAAANVLIKLAGQPSKLYHKIDIDEFKRQAYEFEEFDLNTYHKIVKILISMDETHPPYVIRGAQFFKWLKSGEYEKILNREAVFQASVSTKCSFCGAKTIGDEIFCTFCGNKVGTQNKECISCHLEISEIDIFCTHCGASQK